MSTKLTCMIPGACQPDRTRMSGGRVTDHQLSINSVHGVHGGPCLVLITSACRLDFTWKLRLCSLRRCRSFSVSLLSLSLIHIHLPFHRLARCRLAIRRITKFRATKDSRGASCESGCELNSIRRTGFAGVRSTRMEQLVDSFKTVARVSVSP